VPAALKSLRVPPLILQPIVENAVKHGIAPQRHGGTVVVTARLDPAGTGSTLVLSVRVSGPGITAAELARGRAMGVGLSNVERRLACHYGASAVLSMTSSPDGGTTVDIHMPAEFRLAPGLASSRSAS
jgi:sensor histidine kinase YesM